MDARRPLPYSGRRAGDPPKEPRHEPAADEERGNGRPKAALAAPARASGFVELSAFSIVDSARGSSILDSRPP